MRDHDGALPSGRIRRAAPVAGIAARAAAGRVGASLRRRLGNDRAVLEFHERTAARLADRLSHSRGALMKAGQLLSFVEPVGMVAPENWLPYEQALAALRDGAEVMPGDLAMAVIESELRAPVEALFGSFEPEPLAAASIGQVHAAVLHDGRRVAVKVQYPGVADAIAADLANTELLAQMLKVFQATVPRMPALDGRAVAAELQARITEELDYERERRNLERFALLYADDPAVRIPATHPDLCSSRVLTMDRAEGMGWADALGAPQDLRDRWGLAINRFFFAAIYRHGVFHADPHPGNYVFHDDGTVTVLDFGCVSELDDDTLSGFVELAAATVAGDAERLAAAFHRHGFVGDDAPTPEALLAFYRPTFENLTGPQPYRMTSAFTALVMEALNPYGDDGEISRRFGLPAKFVLTTRIYFGLFSVLAALQACADWRACFDDDLRAYEERMAARR